MKSAERPEHGGETRTEAPIVDVLAAGGLGGALGDSLMYPLDTVKTRQQGADPIAVAERYRTMGQATRTIARQEGLRFGIYRGYTAMLAGSFPSTMLFFGTYESIKRGLRDNTGLNDTFIHFVSGFLGDLASSFVYVPSEVIKTRLQIQGPYNNKFHQSGYNYKGLISALCEIVRTEGPSALFHGYKATMLRDLPFSALQFTFYERFRETALMRQASTLSPELTPSVIANNELNPISNEISSLPLVQELLVGAAAGGLAGVITTPLDVVKTRIQTQTTAEISGITGGLRSIVASQGMLGLFSGVGPRFVWTSVQSSVMLVLYQAALRILAARRNVMYID